MKIFEVGSPPRGLTILSRLYSTLAGIFLLRPGKFIFAVNFFLKIIIYIQIKNNNDKKWAKYSAVRMTKMISTS